MNKAKSRQHGRRAAKRNITNQRTFTNVNKRREKHAKSHGITLAELCGMLNIKRWINKPTKS